MAKNSFVVEITFNIKGVRLSPLIVTQSWSWGSQIAAKNIDNSIYDILSIQSN